MSNAKTVLAPNAAAYYEEKMMESATKVYIKNPMIWVFTFDFDIIVGQSDNCTEEKTDDSCQRSWGRGIGRVVSFGPWELDRGERQSVQVSVLIG